MEETLAEMLGFSFWIKIRSFEAQQITNNKGFMAEGEAKSTEQEFDEFDKNKRIFLKCLKKCMGVVTDAALMANIDRTTHYVWTKKDPKYLEAVESIAESCIDFAESKLFQLMSGITVKEEKAAFYKGVATKITITKTFAPDTKAVTFYLETKGKKRGYIKRTEVERKDVEEFKSVEDIDAEIARLQSGE